MRLGRLGFSSILERNVVTARSTLRSVTAAESPQTASRICSRVSARPDLRVKNSSSPYSLGVNSISTPSRLTRRAPRSTSSEPMVTTSGVTRR